MFYQRVASHFWQLAFIRIILQNIAKIVEDRLTSFSFALMLIRIAFSLDSKISHSFCLITFIYLRLTRIVALWTFSSSYIQLPTLQEEHTTMCASSRCNLGHSKCQCSKFWADWLPARLQIHPDSSLVRPLLRSGWTGGGLLEKKSTKHNFFQHRHHIILLKGCWTPKAERTIFTMNSTSLLSPVLVLLAEASEDSGCASIDSWIITGNCWNWFLRLKWRRWHHYIFRQTTTPAVFCIWGPLSHDFICFCSRAIIGCTVAMYAWV